MQPFVLSLGLFCSFPSVSPLPRPHANTSLWGPSWAGSPGPCPAPLVHILLPAWLPLLSPARPLLQALLVTASTAVLILGVLFMSPWAQSRNSPCCSRQTDWTVHGHIIDRSSAKFLGRFVFKAVNAYASLCFQFLAAMLKQGASN